ncbi:TPA: transposase [Staphylococcus aureus]|nr:transposase [Staphylococcus aureus]
MVASGYNTNNQFVLAYGVYNKPGDTRTLEPFLNEMKELYGDIPDYIVVDAGYGSEYKKRTKQQKFVT